MGYNTDGKRVSVDTLKIGITDDWHEFTTTVHIGNVSYMHLSLEIEGNIPNIEKTLWVNKIQLRINGIDLAQYPSRSLGKEHTLDEKEILKLSFEDPTTYKQIQSLANKRIVALGESIHGSETLEKSAIQIMKYRIMHSNCKLILLELPLEKTLIMNRFVQSDERFDLEGIAKNLGFCLYSHEMLDFLTWVRAYNRTTEHKVFVFGMDAPTTEFYSFATELFDYFYRLNKSRMNDSIKKFLELVLIDCRKAMGPALSSIKEDIDFKNNCDSLEIKIIEHWWNDWLNASMDDPTIVRDSIMYSSAKFMTQLLCAPSETVTLHSHIDHGCYDKTHTISHYPEKSYGSLLKNELGNDYCALGLLAHQGEVLSMPTKREMHQTNNYIKCSLEPVSSNHLEYLLHKSDHDYLYVPVTSLPNTQWYIRTGTQARQLMNIIHPSHYMEGVIYVKESKAMHITHEDVSLYEKYLNLVKLFDKYQSLVK